MDHLDLKQLDFVIYLVLLIDQFQKYHLLKNSLNETVIAVCECGHVYVYLHFT